MLCGYASDHAARAACQVNFHATCIANAAALDYETGPVAAGHQRCRAMGAGLKSLGQFTDAGPLAALVTAHVQQHQVLRGRDAGATRRTFTEAQEPGQMEPEF